MQTTSKHIPINHINQNNEETLYRIVDCGGNITSINSCISSNRSSWYFRLWKELCRPPNICYRKEQIHQHSERNLWIFSHNGLSKNNYGTFAFWRARCDVFTFSSPEYVHKFLDTYSNTGTCWAQNPDAPYGLIMLPPHTTEEIDSYTGYPVVDEQGMSATWKLKESDVIVLMGRTPPECRCKNSKYISFYSSFILVV